MTSIDKFLSQLSLKMLAVIYCMYCAAVAATITTSIANTTLLAQSSINILSVRIGERTVS